MTTQYREWKSPDEIKIGTENPHDSPICLVLGNSNEEIDRNLQFILSKLNA